MNKKLLVLLLLLAPVFSHAQERLVLTVPIVTTVGSDFRLWSLTMRRTHPDVPANITAIYAEVLSGVFVAGGTTAGPKLLTCRYDGEEADAMVIALNKVNLTTTSLEKRVMQRCQIDKKLGAGTILGSPQ